MYLKIGVGQSNYDDYANGNPEGYSFASFSGGVAYLIKKGGIAIVPELNYNLEPILGGSIIISVIF